MKMATTIHGAQLTEVIAKITPFGFPFNFRKTL